MSKLVSYVLLGSVFLAYCGVETTPDPERSGNARLANSAGSDESAIEIMHQELRNWMFLVEQHVMLVPGLKIPGIVEPGHYFSPDYNDSLTNEQDLDLSVTYLMRRIRDGLWHAGYPLNNVHTWKPPVDYGVFDHQPVHYDRIVLNGQVHLWFRVERPDGTQLGVLFPTRVLRTDPLVLWAYPAGYGVFNSRTWNTYLSSGALPEEYRFIPEVFFSGILAGYLRR